MEMVSTNFKQETGQHREIGTPAEKRIDRSQDSGIYLRLDIVVAFIRSP